MKTGRGSYDEPGAKLAQLEMYLHRTTDMALHMSIYGEEEDAVWLPKSQITVTPTEDVDLWIVTMPEWLAIKKDLL